MQWALVYVFDRKAFPNDCFKFLFDSFQTLCRDFHAAGFPLNEELLALSESKEKAAEYRKKVAQEIDRALAKKDYESVARSLYLLRDDPVKFKSTVEVVLQNAPQSLAAEADSISVYLRTEKPWADGILKALAAKVDIGKIIAELIEKEENVFGINLHNYGAFKEAGVAFNEARVSAAFDARLLAEYEANGEDLVPYEVRELMSDAERSHLPFDKDKVSYYANARLLEALDRDVDGSRPQYALLTLDYEIKEMEGLGLKVDRVTVDEMVNTYIKNYVREYADNPSDALYLDDLVKQAKSAGVKLDKEVFELGR